jgi:FAD/FMN-containing dehydrogenase
VATTAGGGLDCDAAVASLAHAAWFKALLGSANAVTGAEDPGLLRAQSTDWVRRWAPKPGDEARLLLSPGTEAEVAACVAYAFEQRIPLVPQGGNTGLVGGSTPCGPDEVILSTRRLNRVLRLDEEEGVLECEAGCVLETLK